MPLPRGHDRPHPSLRDVGRCVVVAQGDDLPAGIVQTLESRAIETVIRAEQLDAFAQLVRWRLDDSADGSWGLPRRRVALVIASRDRWESLDRFLQAIARHFPDVSIWMGIDELLLEITPAQDPAQERAKESVPTPPLRLAGTDVASETLEETPSPRNTPELESGDRRSPPPPEHLEARKIESAVTPEEIEMLLRLFDEMGDDSHDGGSPPQPPKSGPPRGPDQTPGRTP